MFDTSRVTIRRPSEATMENYRRDGDFAYDRTEQKAPESLLERILKWIFGGGIDRAAGVSTGTFTRTLAWILGLTALAYAILKITNTDLRAIFRRKPLAAVGPIIEAGEDIHEMSFDQLIAEALAKNDFRRAVRLNYLKQIRALSDRSLIQWRIDKTNRQYLFELSAADVRKSFGDITRLFEYVWYGDAPVNEQLYRRLSPRFDAFHSMLGGTP
ncbi:MAG: DUF4129 domain-containing protein [Bacteroidetes bacterium]|nr:DUF4129 domain-containing protein [Bacteroidota bacterium]